MSRKPLIGVILAAALVTAAPATAKVRTGPAGAAFYTAPQPLPGHAHGDLIWARRLTGVPVVPGAAKTMVVLYRSQEGGGRLAVTSGVVSIPKGRAPRGGWPVVTWAHGTTGIADQCAPSRDDGTGAVHPYNAYVFPELTSWLKRGYAVVRTDYQGLGTAYDHEYLNGKAEGRNVLDMVRAARRLDPALSKATIIAGHSQGGHAALFAAALAPKYTPELKVRGTVAFAPASHLDEQIPLTTSITAPNPSLDALVATIARGLYDAYGRPQGGGPDDFDPATVMTPTGIQLTSEATTLCLPDLAAQAAGVAPAALFQPGADFTLIKRLLDRNDPSHLTIRTPVLIEQGTADTTVIPLFTDQLAQELKTNGAPRLTYNKVDGVDHGGITGGVGGAAATKWIAARLGA
jgi:pimeloyl-ACP methyl ester carboxylesterase